MKPNPIKWRQHKHKIDGHVLSTLYECSVFNVYRESSLSNRFTMSMCRLLVHLFDWKWDWMEIGAILKNSKKCALVKAKENSVWIAFEITKCKWRYIFQLVCFPRWGMNGTRNEKRVFIPYEFISIIQTRLSHRGFILSIRELLYMEWMPRDATTLTSKSMKSKWR